MRFAILLSHLSKMPVTKKWGHVVRSAAPVMQKHLGKPEDLILQNATYLRKSAHWPPNISDEHVSCIEPASQHASLHILFKRSTLAILSETATKPSPFACFWPESIAPATTSDAWTSKSGPNMWCFYHFDFKMCFAPQQDASFQYRNKCCGTWGVLQMLTSKYALHHNGAHFFWASQLLKVQRTRSHNGVHFLNMQSSASVHVVGCLTSKLPSMTLFSLGSLELLPQIWSSSCQNATSSVVKPLKLVATSGCCKSNILGLAREIWCDSSTKIFQNETKNAPLMDLWFPSLGNYSVQYL